MRSGQHDSRSLNMVVGLLKVIVLLLCIPLPSKEARRLYRGLQSGFHDRIHDSKHPIGPIGMLFTGLRDVYDVLPEVMDKADLNVAIYNFVDVPVGLLVYIALPSGGCFTLAALVGGADNGTAIVVGLGTVLLFWCVGVAVFLRSRIHRDLPDVVEVVAAGDPNRVATVPNALSALRLLVGAPLLVQTIAINPNLGAAAFVLLFCGITDWLDGNLARRFGQDSRLGKALDRLADRAVMFCLAGSFLLVGGPVPIWLMVLILVRESMMATATVVLGALGAKPISVVWWGKVGCALVVIGMTIVLLPNIEAGWLRPEGSSMGYVMQRLGSMITLLGVVSKYIATVQYARAIPGRA